MDHPSEKQYHRSPSLADLEVGREMSNEEYIANQKVAQLERLVDIFSYHPPDDGDQSRFKAIRSAARHFAEVILDNTPVSPDQSDAVRKVREAMMTANAAIALKGRS